MCHTLIQLSFNPWPIAFHSTPLLTSLPVNYARTWRTVGVLSNTRVGGRHPVFAWKHHHPNRQCEFPRGDCLERGTAGYLFKIYYDLRLFPKENTPQSTCFGKSWLALWYIRTVAKCDFTADNVTMPFLIWARSIRMPHPFYQYASVYTNADSPQK